MARRAIRLKEGLERILEQDSTRTRTYQMGYFENSMAGSVNSPLSEEADFRTEL